MQHNENDLVPLHKKILFSIWLLAKQESFLSAGDRFGFSKSTGHGIFTSIIKVLSNLMPQFLKWPDNENYETISRVCSFFILSYKTYACTHAQNIICIIILKICTLFTDF